MPSTLLVIPAFNERARLPPFLLALCGALQGMEVTVRVVDDGSSPEQQAWLRDYIAEMCTTLSCLEPAQINTHNAGKGGAVYSGWDGPGGAELLAFADADGAVPPEEVARVIRVAALHPLAATYAVRTGAEGTRVVRSLPRRLAGAVFRWLVRRLFHFPVPDTQCGCKVIPAAAYAAVRSELSEHRFTFDVELTWHLLRRGVEVRALPVHWSERPGSHLRAASVCAMFKSLRALRRQLGNWKR